MTQSLSRLRPAAVSAPEPLVMEDMSEEAILRLLDLLTVRYCKEMWINNLPTLRQYPTTMPMFEIAVVPYLCFIGDLPYPSESLCMVPAHVTAMERGERVRYRYDPQNPLAGLGHNAYVDMSNLMYLNELIEARQK